MWPVVQTAALAETNPGSGRRYLNMGATILSTGSRRVKPLADWNGVLLALVPVNGL